MQPHTQPTIYYWENARAPHHVLCNYYQPSHAIKVTYPDMAHIQPFARARTFEFPTAEHAYQALHAEDEKTFRLFVCGGALTLWSVYDQWPAKPGQADTVTETTRKRFVTWGKKYMSGIIANDFVRLDPIRLRALFGYARLRPMPQLSQREKVQLWSAILMPKFSPDRHEGKVLARTGGHYLLAYVRMASSHTDWGGKIAKNTHRLVGQNFNGKMLMHVRDMHATTPTKMVTSIATTTTTTYSGAPAAPKEEDGMEADDDESMHDDTTTSDLWTRMGDEVAEANVIVDAVAYFLKMDDT